MVDNCKHVNRIKNSLELGILQPERWQCCTCFTTESIWACLSCSNIACGRYISEHALAHYKETKHPLCIEINEKFVFCYECDDYILNDNAPGDIKLIRMALDAVCKQEFEPLRQVKGGKRILRSKLIANNQQKSQRLMLADHVQTALVKLRISRLSGALKLWREALYNKQCATSLSVNAGSPTKSCSVASSSSRPRQATKQKVVKRLYSLKSSKSDPLNHRHHHPLGGKSKLIPYAGLRNLGNTCYINSVLQVLSHTAAFSNFIVTHPPESTLPELRECNNGEKRSISANCFDLVDSPITSAFSSERLPQRQCRKTNSITKKVNNKLLPSKCNNNTINAAKQQHAWTMESNTIDLTTMSSVSSSASVSSNTTTGGGGGLQGGSTILKHPEALTYASQPATTLYEELHALFQVLWSGQRAVVSPHSLLYALWVAVPSFKGYKQQDAQEFLSVLLDKMQTEIQPRGEKWDPKWQNFITRAFQGSLESTIKCSNCKHEVKNEEVFLDLSLAFPSNSTNPPGGSSSAQSDVRIHLIDILAAFSAETPIESYEKLEDDLNTPAPAPTAMRTNPSRSSRRIREALLPSLVTFTRKCYACPRCCCASDADIHGSHSFSSSSVVDYDSDSRSVDLMPSDNASSQSPHVSSMHNKKAKCNKVNHKCSPFVQHSPPHPPEVWKDTLSETLSTTITTTTNAATDIATTDAACVSRNSSDPFLCNDKYSQRLVEATQTLKICRLPKVLRLHLKRFRWIGRQREKISTHVDFPELLDLSSLCTEHLHKQYNDPPPSDLDFPACFIYQLTGVVVHHGKGFQSGHYTSFCLSDNNDWLHYNDSHVTHCHVSDVLRAQAYILVYSQLMPSATGRHMSLKTMKMKEKPSHCVSSSPPAKRRCFSVK